VVVLTNLAHADPREMSHHVAAMYLAERATLGNAN